MEEGPSNTKTAAKSYIAAFKLQVIEYAEQNSNRAASREFEVNEKLIRDWRKIKNELTELPPDSTHLPSNPVRKLGPKKHYTPAFKLDAIKLAEETSNRASAKEFEIDEKMLREWRNKKDQLESIPIEKRDVHSSGLRPMFPKLEEQLVAWFNDQPERPSYAQIQAKALDLYDGEVSFKASRGWLDKFLHRHDLFGARSLPVETSIETIDIMDINNMAVENVVSQIVPPDGEQPVIEEVLDVTTETSPTKRRRFNPSFKLKVVSHAEAIGSNREAGRIYDVDEKLIRIWKAQREGLKEMVISQGGDPSEAVAEFVIPAEPTPPRNKGKKRKYEAAFKLHVVAYAEQNSNRGAGRRFNVDEKRVREWRKHKADIEVLPVGKYKTGKCGCHPIVPELENELETWIRTSPVRPTHAKIQAKALELYADEKYIGEKTFKASRGWLDKFLTRKNLKLASPLRKIVTKAPEVLETSQPENSQSMTVEIDNIEESVIPEPMEVSNEELNEMDIQACLNLAKTIEESVKQGGDEGTMILAKSIEESVKKSIVETLAKAQVEQTTGVEEIDEESLIRSVVESVQKSMQTTQQ